MAEVQGPFLVAVLLFLSPGLHCSSPPPACPEPCTCQRAPLLNCSSSGLSSVPQHIRDSVTELDLSQNRLDTVTLHRPYRYLRNVWLENNSITRLSLCIDRNPGIQYLRSRHSRQLGPWSQRRCVSWAPALQLLSVERNQLIQLPQGLEGSASLWVLQLSFNRISTLRPGQLRHLRQLKELHLKHNLITRLHPQMFQDLAQLRVLDLSFNMLTSLHPSMYLSLHNIGSVRLDGNRWQCDCSMRNLRRRMVYDSNRGLQTWSVVCASPSVLSGKDLLQLEEDDLNCSGTENSLELHRDVTVYSGSEILLSCSKQDSSWLMPSGQESVSQPHGSLFIGDVAEKDAGLYVCMTENHEVVSVFNLQIRKVEHARRKTRSLPRTSRQVIPQDATDRIGQERNQSATQSDLALAVCLSVFITFLVAFILGVLARPFIDVFCKRNKRSRSASNSVSSAEQRQYENEAYSEGEDPEEIVTNRERRVKFSIVNSREDINAEYYDTVASGNQQSVEAAKTEEDEQTAGDSGSENGSRQLSPENNQRDARDLSGTTDTRHRHKGQHTPDSEELQESSSLHSDSSLSDRELKKDHMNKRDHKKPKSLQQAEDSVQQGAERVQEPQLSNERTSETLRFSSEPVADWSPHDDDDAKPTDSDLWQGDEELFDFSDSVRSNSARSSGLFGSFKDSKLKVLTTTDNQSRDDASSCSSYLSENEPTEYTLNQDQEEEEDTENNHNTSELTNTCLKQDASFQQRPGERSELLFSSQSSDSEEVKKTAYEKAKKEEVTEYYKPSSRIVAGKRDPRERIKPMTRSKWRGVSLGVTSFGLDPTAASPPTAYSSSSSSESETEITDRTVKRTKGRKGQKYLVINAPLSASNSSSSDETRDVTTKHTARQEQREAGSPFKDYALDLENIAPIKRRLDVKAPSRPPDSSSSSDSEDETTHLSERPGRLGHTKLSFQTASHDPDARWPALDLENIAPIKRRLDVKAPSRPPDSSSSSDSEDETTGHTEKTRPQKVGTSGLLSRESPTANWDPDARWPVLDLENIAPIKRRLDVKAPSRPPDSSSSSDSEDETTGHTEKKRPQKVGTSGLLSRESQTASHDPDARWPVLDLENIAPIKRRLDVKAPSRPPDSSSSSDSEDETTGHTEKTRPQKVGTSGLLSRESPTANWDPDARWPVLDLENIAPIKRRLDVKAPSRPPDSSSSSDSEDETTGHTEKKRPQKVGTSGLLSRESQTASHDPDARWPVLDLENIAPIKRRLDVKAPSRPPDSSSSSDSEDETTGHTEKKRPQKVGTSGLLSRESQTASHDPDARWPVLDLENIAPIKRRLDVKAPSRPPDSSSSSDSEDETTGHTEKTRPQKVGTSGLLSRESPTANWDPDARWPVLDLENIAPIKRRLDVKAPSRPPDSSSSSDSEDETTGHTEKKRPQKVGTSGLLSRESQTASHDPDARWPVLDLENIAPIKRRLDVKAPSLPPDSSSSSDSEDETTHLSEKPGRLGHTKLSFQTASHDPDARWPVLDLGNIAPIKRRLDVKAPSRPPDSSSSSDSEDETTGHTEKKRPQKVGTSGLLSRESQTASHDPDARWPVLDLENIPNVKRRLDVKAPSLPPDSSSSSDSEDETTGHTEKTRPQKVEEEITHHKERPGKVDIVPTKTYEQDRTTFPLKVSETVSHDPLGSALNLNNITRIKRRLDIRAPSSPPESLSDGITNHTEEGKIKEANKISPHYSSSSSVEHDEYTEDIYIYKTNKSFSPINRPLNIRGPPQPADSSFSSSDKGRLSSTTVKHEMDKDGVRITTQEQQTMMHEVNLGNPNLRRRLDIKAPSSQADLILDNTSAHIQHSESNSSTSESEDENGDHKFKWFTKTPLITVPYKPKEVHTIKLEKYTVITDDLRDKPTDDSISPTPEINPELHSRWATMNLGVSHFRKCLEITSNTNVTPYLPKSPLPDSPSLVNVTEETSNPDTPLTGIGTPYVSRYLDSKLREEAPATLPLHQQSDSLSSSESEGIPTENTGNRWRETSQLSVVQDVAAPQNPTSLLVTLGVDESCSGTQVEREVGVQLNSQASGEGDVSDSMWPNLSLKNIPNLKRDLDIGAPLQRKSSSSSNSEDETHHTVPALKPPVPRINRRLNLKAPLPEPKTSLSSSSESDNEATEYTAKQTIRSSYTSGMTDDDYSQIAYKRSIIKPPRPRNYFSSSSRSQTSDHPVAQAGLSHRASDRSAPLSQLEDSSNDQYGTLGAELPPEIRWMGIGRDRPDFSSASRRLDLGLPPPQPEVTPPDSSTFSDQIKEDGGKAYETLMHRYSYPTTGRVSVASGGSLGKFDNTSRSKNEIFRALSEDRKEKKGLGALKAMSSKRLQWDTVDKDLDAV